MHIEIERKFLVINNDFIKKAINSIRIKQGYIACQNGRTVRVRTWNDTAFLTIKGPSKDGMSKMEWEKEIPIKDAEDLFLLCQQGVIDKTRYIIPTENKKRFFEVDVFYGDNEGLIMAEIELDDKDENFIRPSFLGKEVTGDYRFFNAALSKNPYRNWDK